MIKQLTYIFWIFFISISFIAIKYNQSRNKKQFLKEGEFLSLVWSIIIFVGLGSFIAFVLPEDPVKFTHIQLHSQNVVNHLNDVNPISRYFYLSLSVFSELNLIGLLCATFILIIWLYYIIGLDFFNKEKTKYTVVTLFFGIAISFFTFPLSDYVHSLLEIKYSENTFYNLFVYSFLGTAIVEELIKLIPVLIILFFTKEIDEPIDLIFYASISALGFAFIENLIYFREISGSIVIERGLFSAVGHMIFSSIVVYGILLYRYNKEGRKPAIILYYYILGAFVHALYNYFLFEDLTLFFFATFLFFNLAWTIMINNAINNSKYFDYTIEYSHNKVKVRLALQLASLFIIMFAINGFMVGKKEATNEYISTLSWAGLLIIFYVSRSSSFDLFRGYWRPVLFRFSSPNNIAMPGMRAFGSFSEFFTENTILPLNHVGKKIKLHSPAFNKHLCEIFHISEGLIVDRIKLVNENGKTDIDWFLVNLKTSLNINNEYEKNLILIKLRSKSYSLIHDEHIECYLRLIPAGMDPQLNKENSCYISFGFIMINGEDYEYKE